MSIDPQEEKRDQEKEDYLLGWKRALADYDNLKKDLVREKTLTRQALAEDFFLAVLPVLDHFHQALRHEPKPGDPTVDAWVRGVLLVRDELAGAMARFGASPFGEVGERFDPARHESVGSRTEDGAGEETILEILEPGWLMAGKVIRPAKVIINLLVPSGGEVSENS